MIAGARSFVSGFSAIYGVFGGYVGGVCLLSGFSGGAFP